MSDFLSIPGNIRQQYMPFTIEGPGKKQVFSFKKSRKGNGGYAFGQIHPFSRHLETLIANDSGIQYTHGPDGSGKVTLEQFLDSIPAIQIREYVPDAKLTQTFKWFSYLKRGFDTGLKNLDSMSFNPTQIKKELETVVEGLTQKMRELTSGDASLLAKIAGFAANIYQDKGYNIGDDNGFAVLYLPFILYYRLTTTCTNNVYEVPYSMSNEIMKSDGTYGWASGNSSDFGFLDRMGESVASSTIAKLAFGSTIRVNMMPSFQPNSETHAESFTITFDLINDSDEAAIYNFLMCHNLFGNNRWLQYGFVQASASLYDVRFPGANRYLMCSGQFSCRGKGVFRTPNDTILNAIKNCVHETKTFSGFLGSDEGSSVREAIIGQEANFQAQQYIDRGAGVAPSPFFGQEIALQQIRTKADSNGTAIFSPRPEIRNENVFSVLEETKAKKYETWRFWNEEMVGAKKDVAACRDVDRYKSLIEKTNNPQRRQWYQEQIDSIMNENSIFKDARAAENEALRCKTEAIDASRAANVVPGYPSTTTEDIRGLAQKQRESVLESESILRQVQSDLDAAVASGAPQPVIDGLEREVSKYEAIVSNGREKEALLTAAADAAGNADSAGESAKNALKAVSEKSAANLKEATEKSASARAEFDNAFRGDAKAAVERRMASSTVTVDNLREIIKIPDAYSVTLTFNSLIPDNFNNYLYGFRAANLDPILDYAKGKVDERGVFEKLADKLEAEFGS